MDHHHRYLRHCCHCTIVAIVTNGATGSIGAIGSPNDPLTLNGDCELSIAIEWIKWRHFNGANGRQWRSPLSPMDVAIGATDRIAIGDNGTSIGATYCRHWRQWRQMIHSPNYLKFEKMINQSNLICGIEFTLAMWSENTKKARKRRKTTSELLSLLAVYHRLISCRLLHTF